jgi:hypothetical protein
MQLHCIIRLSGAGRAENRIAVGRVEMPQNSRAIDYCYLESCIFERRNDALRNQFCFLWIQALFWMIPEAIE